VRPSSETDRCGAGGAVGVACCTSRSRPRDIKRKTYSEKTTSVEGTTTDRFGHWNAMFTELSGGDASVVEAFNHAGRIAATEQIDRAKSESNPANSGTSNRAGK
jgi:hypothetical protein